MKYLIQYDSVRSYKLRKLLNQLRSSDCGLKVSDLSIRALTHDNGVPITSGRGVYIFKAGGIAAYVGVSASRSFVERIPVHLDPTPDGWFNSLLKAIIAKNAGAIRSDAEKFAHAARTAQAYSLALINFSNRIEQRDKMKTLERILIARLEPALNKMSVNTRERIVKNTDEQASVEHNVKALAKR